MTVGHGTIRYYVALKDRERVVDLTEHEDGTLGVVLDGEPVDADLAPLTSSLHSLLLNGHSREMVLERDGARVLVYLDGERLETTVLDEVSRAVAQITGGAVAGGSSDVCAPMPGVVVSIPVTVGDAVEAGQPVIVVEAMKMQNELAVAHDGVVSEVLVAERAAVSAGQVLVRLTPVPAGSAG
jgi:biotin carboxyl carrier protein